MTTTEQTLRTLATNDPDFPRFAAALPPELADHAALPDTLSEDVLAVLRRERPELAPWLDAQKGASAAKFSVDPETFGILAAILFLLRSHIKIEGSKFLIEHKPMGDELLKKVLDTLASLSGGNKS